MSDLVCAKIKQIVNLQDIIKSNEPRYKSKSRKV